MSGNWWALWFVVVVCLLAVGNKNETVIEKSPKPFMYDRIPQ